MSRRSDLWRSSVAEETSAAAAAFGGLGAVAKPAFDHMAEEIAQVQRRWLLVADIFQMIVDMAHDDRIALRRGPSISKAIELCEIERTMPGHSQLRKAWSDFRDVAHLIAASAYLAHAALAKTPHAASILKALWIAPDAVIALACGFQEFWLQHDSGKEARQTLQHDNLWQIPTGLIPEKPGCCAVPAADDTIETLADNCVIR